MQLNQVLNQFDRKHLIHLKGFGTPLLIMAALAMVVLPMPPMLLDILFSFNIALALVVLLRGNMFLVLFGLLPQKFSMQPLGSLLFPRTCVFCSFSISAGFLALYRKCVYLRCIFHLRACIFSWSFHFVRIGWYLRVFLCELPHSLLSRCYGWLSRVAILPFWLICVHVVLL